MRSPFTARRLGAWTSVAAVGVGVSVVLWYARVPSPVLFGSLLAGMAHALWGRGSLDVPGVLFGLGQALIGVTVGAMVSLSTLRALGGDGLAILGAAFATLLISVLAGQVLRLREGVTATTGAFAMVAGGASGMVSIARDLGADEQVVTIVQYLRILLVLLVLPLVTTAVFGASAGDATGGTRSTAPLSTDLVFTVLACGVGVVVARHARIPTGTLLCPLVVAVALSVAGVFGDVGVPVTVQNVAYALIGIQVGLRFTRESLRSIARLLPLAVVMVAVVIAACAGLGVLLAEVTGVSLLDGYLATTPGGLYAVLAIAAESGTEVTFILAAQVIRLFAMLLAAPGLARILRSRG